MKTVLRNKARNIHRKLDIQEQREAAASNFDESIFDSLITEDSYALETMMPFRVKEQVFVVTPHIGNALSYLQPKYSNAIKLIENALKEARQGAFRVRNCHDFEKMCMPNRRRGTPPEKL